MCHDGLEDLLPKCFLSVEDYQELLPGPNTLNNRETLSRGYYTPPDSHSHQLGCTFRILVRHRPRHSMYAASSYLSCLAGP